jgi:hypothetical protein
MPDDNGDEADGKDETMVPVDYQSSGQIRDDVIFEELVAKLPEGVTLKVQVCLPPAYSMPQLASYP